MRWKKKEVPTIPVDARDEKLLDDLAQKNQPTFSKPSGVLRLNRKIRNWLLGLQRRKTITEPEKQQLARLGLKWERLQRETKLKELGFEEPTEDQKFERRVENIDWREK